MCVLRNLLEVHT